ncbi:MAG: FAD-binding oxidoreductase [Gammaproteobacteria bacterium]
MRKITYQNKQYDCLDNETVLQTLQRHKINVPYSCSIGVCQSCLLKTSSTDIPERSQQGLSKKLISKNYFLPCVCKPKDDFNIIESSEHEIYLDSVVIEKNWLSTEVCQFILQKPDDLEFNPGQFVNVRNKDLVTRSYSIASAPHSDNIELHVKHLQNGQMSNWMCNILEPGDAIELQGANGDNYYDAETKNQNILLIATGTGLAPLLGIVRDALAQNHQGDIHVYHGSRYCDGLYHIETMRELEKQHPNMQYYPCISSSNPLLNNTKRIPDCIHERADEFAIKSHPTLKGWKVYLCGHPYMVKKVKAKAYIAGASLNDIHIDAFELKDLRTQDR